MAHKIYTVLQNVRVINNDSIDDHKYDITHEPAYVEPVPEFSKISRFEDDFTTKYYGKSRKLNVAATVCMKKLAFNLQCYIAKEINHKDASNFDKIVGVYDAKHKVTKFINKLKKKIKWNNKIFKLFRELALLVAKIACNFILPGSSSIFHFINAARHYYNGDTKQALCSCAFGIATIVTAGFFDEIMDITETLLDGLQNINIFQSIIGKAKGIIKAMARLLKPLLNGYVRLMKPFVDMIARKLTIIGITSQLNPLIAKHLCKFRIFVDELLQANDSDRLDGFLTEQINDFAKETVDDCIKDNIGNYENINDATNHLMEKTNEKIMEFCYNEMKHICKDKGIKLKIPLFGNNKLFDNNDDDNCLMNDDQLSDEDILLDKQRMIDDVGIFIDNINNYYKNSKVNMNGSNNMNPKSEIKIFNRNCDSMIFISIKRDIEMKRKQYEYKSNIHCVVMFAANDEAKTQFLIQKLIMENTETPGNI